MLEVSSSSSTLSCPTVPVIPIKFITHCFYLTHKCLMLGLTQTIHLYNDTRRMLGRVSNLYCNNISFSYCTYCLK